MAVKNPPVKPLFPLLDFDLTVRELILDGGKTCDSANIGLDIFSRDRMN